jgi:hypothetical protein
MTPRINLTLTTSDPASELGKDMLAQCDLLCVALSHPAQQSALLALLGGGEPARRPFDVFILTPAVVIPSRLLVRALIRAGIFIEINLSDLLNPATQLRALTVCRLLAGFIANRRINKKHYPVVINKTSSSPEDVACILQVCGMPFSSHAALLANARSNRAPGIILL